MVTYLTLCLSLFISGVFLVASAGKLRGRGAFGEFVVSVAAFSGLRLGRARPLALALAVGEPVVAVLVLVPVTRAVGLAGAAVLLAGFTAALVRAVRGRSRTPCHCFGARAEPASWRHVARNGVLLSAVAVDAVSVLGRAGGGRLEPDGLAVCVLAAGVAVAIVALLDDIAAVFGPPPERLR